MINKISAVIPAYNESDRVLNILENALQAENIDEIIVVNDGSSDDTHEQIESFLQRVRMDVNRLNYISHETNQGKTAALQTGINSAKHENILMLDADIIGMKPQYIDEMITAFFDSRADMLIYHKDLSENKFVQFMDNAIGSELLYCGERIVKKEILKEVLQQTSGYLLETDLNLYCIENNKQIALFEGPYFHHIVKSKKEGILTGMIKDSQMSLDILRKRGIGNFFKQLNVFKSLPRVKSGAMG